MSFYDNGSRPPSYKESSRAYLSPARSKSYRSRAGKSQFAGSVDDEKDHGNKKLWRWAVALICVILIAVALVLVFFVFRKQVLPSAADDQKGKCGGNGSNVTRDDGSTFVYNNSFGGTWCSIPWNDTARAQADVPALNETWDYLKNAINGVNLGGWLVLEPFIVPSIFEPFANASTPAVDEYTCDPLAFSVGPRISPHRLSTNLGPNLTQTLTAHYDTFITEDDVYQIAAAGLNWVRIPLPFWAIETISGEPFLEGVAWTYFLKAIEWCRKYGLRINLDLHTAPGSQNGFNHSGRLNIIAMLNGPMGIVNAQRTLNYIRTLAEFITQPTYTQVICMFSFLNEPMVDTIGETPLRSFYFDVYTTIRGMTPPGQGPFLAIGDNFVAPSETYGFMAGADRLALDSHPYLAFAASQLTMSVDQCVTAYCQKAGATFNTTMNSFGFAFAGEFSLAMNDCGQWVHGVNQPSQYEAHKPGQCAQFLDYQSYSPAFKAQLQAFAQSQMDANRNYFFWTWKIGNSSVTGNVPNPQWSYQLGLQQGYILANPRAASGACPSIVKQYGGPSQSTVPVTALQPWMTGGAGAGDITDPNKGQYASFPLANYSTFLAFAPTGTPKTLPTADISGAGNGWADARDTGKWYVPTATTGYLDP